MLMRQQNFSNNMKLGGDCLLLFHLHYHLIVSDMLYDGIFGNTIDLYHKF